MHHETPPLVVAVRHAPHLAARAARGEHVVVGIPDHQGPVDLDLHRLAGGDEHVAMWLAPHAVVARDDRGEEGPQLEAIEEAQRERARLVGDQRHANAGVPKAPQSLDHARVSRRRGPHRRRIVMLEALDGAIEVHGLAGASFKCALDQRAHATPDQCFHRRARQRRQAELGERALERERDLAGGLDERAVEVEDHGAEGARHHGAAHSSTNPAAKLTNRGRGAECFAPLHPFTSARRDT